MGLAVSSRESLTADVSVTLRGGHIRVTQKFLHSTQIGASVEEVGRKAVPKGVGMGRAWANAGRRSDERPAVVRRLPRSLPNSASPCSAARTSERTSSQRRSATTAGSLSGTRRSLEPLPHTVAAACASASEDTSRPHSSPTRRPEP